MRHLPVGVQSWAGRRSGCPSPKHMAKQEEISGPADFLTRGDSSWTRPTGPGGCPGGGSVPSPGHAVGAWRGGWHPGVDILGRWVWGWADFNLSILVWKGRTQRKLGEEAGKSGGGGSRWGEETIKQPPQKRVFRWFSLFDGVVLMILSDFGCFFLLQNLFSL